MAGQIILLCDEVERPFLSETLTAHAPGLTILHCMDAAALEAVKDSQLRVSRLVAFCTSVIVPPRLLEALGFGAYNFHPGSPAFPGWMPAAFAIYTEATEFGATAHVITERVDEGSIIGIEMFPVQPNIVRADLAQQTYLAVLRLFRRLAPVLARDPAPPVLPIKWGPEKSSRALFATMCNIPVDIEAGELRRRIAAFGAGDGISVPTVRIHGTPFRYSSM
jgi:methionyl-tRNA formyltransferase